MEFFFFTIIDTIPYLRQNMHLSKFAFYYFKCTLGHSSFLCRHFGLLGNQNCYKKT